MAPDAPSGSRPAPVALRIKLRYDDVETMVQRFACNVGKSGLFLPTKSLQPIGAEVKFEIRIANDAAALVGLGRVKAAKAPDPAHPKAAFGMSIELMRVTPESRALIVRMLERRKQLGLPELAIPLAVDVDAARRSDGGDSAIKDTASVSVPAPVVDRDSAPILSAPMPGGDSAPSVAPRPEGPLAVAKSSAVPALAPEPPRRKRPALDELIERASGPIAATTPLAPGDDAALDVEAVLARARVLAGATLDAELAALRELAAAPVEISVEAASAELARKLGGAAVKGARDRSARWARASTPIAALGEAAAVSRSAPSTTVVVEAAPAVEVAPAVEDEPALEAAPALEADGIESLADALRDSDPELEARTASPTAPLRDSVPAIEVEPEQIADEIHQLGAHDMEELEHTHIGTIARDPLGAAEYVLATEPGTQAELARSLDAQLADAEAEADDFGFRGDDVGVRAQLDHLADEDGEADEDIEELDELEILAEADDQDADPGAVQAERSSDHDASRLSDSDFASRLDLSDEFEAVPEAYLAGGDGRPAEHALPLDALHPHVTSAGHALSAFDDNESARTVTSAAALPLPDFPSLHELDQSEVMATVPRTQHVARARRAPTADGFDLETALDALDVDLDDLAIPHAKTELPAPSLREAGKAPQATPPPGTARVVAPASIRRARGRGAPRATTEDGVLIDFEDEDD